LNFSPEPVRADYRGKLALSNYPGESYTGLLRPYEAAVLRSGVRI
jgi:hypothetical protein